MTSVQEIYENNLRRQYTDADAKQFDEAEKGLAAAGMDVYGVRSDKQRVIDFIDNHFQTHRNLPVTVQNIYWAVEQRKNEFIWLSPAETKWYQVAQQNPELANQLATHLAAHGGRPGQLANDGDALFENLTLLFTEIHSHPQPIAHAEDRIAHRPGRQLRRVAHPRRTEPQSAAAKADADYSIGKPFSASDLVKNADGSLRSKTPAEQRRDMEAAERAKQPDLALAQSRAVAEAQRKAEQLRGNSHSEDAQLQAIFVTTPGTSEIDWPSTLTARQRMQQSLNKAREVRRFVR
jgi:hypothetical protein